MPNYVCKGAKLKCSMGSSQSDLNVIQPVGSVHLSNSPMATIMDYKPMVNIMPFGKCKSPANPVVAAATAANYGRLQEMPCIPNITTPWINGHTGFYLKGQPVLMDNGKCMCMWAGKIEIAKDGQTVSGNKKKSRTGATGVTKEVQRCQLCSGDLKDEVHKSDKPKKKSSNLVENILGGKDIKKHTFYEKGNTPYEKGQTPQAHHLISRSAIKKWKSACDSIGYNINCKENGVILPSSPQKACQYRVQKHQGGHIKTYYIAVRHFITDVFDGYDKMCDKNTKDSLINKLNSKSKTILNNIKDFKFLLQKDSLNYHKDCVIGCSEALISGKNKKEVSDLNVTEIEKVREDAKNLIAKVMLGDSNAQSDAQTAQNDFNKKADILDTRLICKKSRKHGSSEYTLTVANAK